MKCPCCKRDMITISNHAVADCEETGVERRHHITYLCSEGGNVCNGLLVKHDIYDSNLTYITPAHSLKTLHINYVNGVSTCDLLRTIFTVFEWEAYVKSLLAK
jgi:hypothetical protein